MSHQFQKQHSNRVTIIRDRIWWVSYNNSYKLCHTQIFIASPISDPVFRHSNFPPFSSSLSESFKSLSLIRLPQSLQILCLTHLTMTAFWLDVQLSFKLKVIQHPFNLKSWSKKFSVDFCWISVFGVRERTSNLTGFDKPLHSKCNNLLDFIKRSILGGLW